MLLLSPVAYAQPARPVPPAFSPAQDAPHTVGQPGHLEPQALPRSPHKRVLPPEKGPGIWAGDPVARDDDGQGEPDGGPHLLDVPLPIAEPYGSLDVAVPQQCALELTDAVRLSQKEPEVMLWDPPQRRCAAAMWYEKCVEAKGRLPGLSNDLRAAMQRAAGKAARFREVECDGPNRLGIDKKPTWASVLTRWLARGHR